MKGATQHPMRWIRAYAVVAVLLAALVAGWALSASILSSPELLIREVEIDGLVYLSDEDVLARASLDRPTSTLKVQRDIVVARLQNDPWIRSVQLQRPRREKLRIVIEESTPRLIVATPTLMLADAQGKIIDDVVPMYEHLPLLTGATRKQPAKDTGANNNFDPRLLALSRGLGGATVDDELEEALDVDVVRDAVYVLDTWKKYAQHTPWTIQEVLWNPAEGFTLWLSQGVELTLGHREFDARLQRASIALDIDTEAIDTLVRVDVRPSARAVLRFDVATPTAGDGGER